MIPRRAAKLETKYRIIMDETGRRQAIIVISTSRMANKWRSEYSDNIPLLTMWSRDVFKIRNISASIFQAFLQVQKLRVHTLKCRPTMPWNIGSTIFTHSLENNYSFRLFLTTIKPTTIFSSSQIFQSFPTSGKFPNSSWCRYSFKTLNQTSAEPRDHTSL